MVAARSPQGPEPDLADIFKEVEEELRREQYEKLWQRHGKLLIAIAAAAIIGTAAYVGWQKYRANELASLSDRYAAALTLTDPAAGDPAAAEAAFAELQDAGRGYGTLAQLQAAGLKSKTDPAAAAALYDRLAADKGAPDELRDLARLLKVMQLVETGDGAALSAELQPLVADTSPWRFTARELQAVLALKAGDRSKATELLTQLSDDVAAPPSLRARAAELLAALKG
jgi:hypothetical protein